MKSVTKRSDQKNSYAAVKDAPACLVRAAIQNQTTTVLIAREDRMKEFTIRLKINDLIIPISVKGECISIEEGNLLVIANNELIWAAAPGHWATFAEESTAHPAAEIES